MTDSRFLPRLGLILLLDALANLPFLGMTTLAHIDEARISEVAREMVASGDWVVPRIGGAPFASYPPLAYWLLAATGWLLGFNEFAMRLPSVLAGIALVGLTGLTARRLAGERAGLMAAAVLATTPTFFLLQSSARADVVVALFAALAFDRFLAVAEEGDRRARTLVVFYLAIAAGILSKGPLGLVLPGLGIAGWLLLRRRWRVLLDLRPWWGVPATLALVAPWFVAVARRPDCGEDFLKVNLMLENVRAFTHGFERPKPVWFYAQMGFPRLLPWVLVFLLAWPVRRARGLAVALVWAVAVLAFLHLSSAKRVSYLTYFSPGFAVAAGIVVDALIEARPRLLRGALLGTAAVVAAAALVTPLLPVRWDTGWPVSDLILPFAAGAGVAAVILLGVTETKGPSAGIAVLATALLMCAVAHLVVLGPRMDAEGRRWRDFARRVDASVPRETPIFAVGPEHVEPCLYFYLRRTLPSRSGEPGCYVAPGPKRDALLERGLRVHTFDVVRDDRDRPIYFFQVLP